MRKPPHPFNTLREMDLNYLELDSGYKLFQQGEKTTAIYYLQQGTVTLSRWGANGDEIIIHTARDGESFAEAALFSDNYHCLAQTRTPCILWKISKPSLLKAFSKEPEFALALTTKFAQQVQILRHQKELLAIRSAPERVYAAMCEGMLTSDIKLFAASIGLAHETVYRALAKLVDEKSVVKTARGLYEISFTV